MSRIEFVTETETNVQNILEDAYELRKDRPHLWLQKLCCFVMRKLEAFHISETMTFTKHVIDTDLFMDRIITQKHYLFSLKKHPTLLLIGSEDFAKLMCSPEVRESMYFMTEYMDHNTIHGLKVQIVPWMRGILVMP